MTPDLEQLADEAIEVRCTHVESAIGHLRIPIRDWTVEDDHLQRTRDLITGNWGKPRPALAALADARLAAIARLAQQGVTPAPGCTVTVGRVTLEAVRDLHPVSHRYRVLRGREQAGWTWLSSDDTWEPGTYIAVLDEVFLFGPHLAEVLNAHAEYLNAEPLTEAGTR